MLIDPSRFVVAGGGGGGGGDYTLYRIVVSANNGDAYVGLGELYGYAAVAGADVFKKSGALAGNFTDSGSYGSYYGLYAFGLNQSTRYPVSWVGSGGGSGWLRFESTGGPIRVRTLGLVPNNGETGRMPSALKVRYSDDGVTWSDALSVTGIPAWTNGELRIFPVPNLGSHTWWEYNEVANQGDGYCSLGACYMVLDNGEFIRTGAYNVGVRESSSYGGYPLMNALDRGGGYYVSGGGPPQTFEIVSPVTLAEFGFQCAEVNRMPKDFILEGWNESTLSWDLLKTVINQTGWTVGETRRYAV